MLIIAASTDSERKCISRTRMYGYKWENSNVLRRCLSEHHEWRCRCDMW